MPYKILTHDHRPPLQGGKPLFDGTPGYILPTVAVDMSDAECGNNGGWHYSLNLAEALRIAGLWRDGWPAEAWLFEPLGERNEQPKLKPRSASGCFVRRLSEDEIAEGVGNLTSPWAGTHIDRLVRSQMDWRHALSRPRRDPEAIVSHLRVALDRRGLGTWTTRHYLDARVARDARAAWAARDARAARDAWAAWDAWAARVAWDARDARAAWTARAARDAWAARDARDALTVEAAALMGWHGTDPDLFTTGIREAYEAGLEVALTTDSEVLGWAMVEQSSSFGSPGKRVLCQPQRLARARRGVS